MEFSVPTMSCGHCVAAIEQAIKAADPHATLACDLGTRRVSITSTLPAPALRAALKDAGYEAEPVGA
ncbi:heavy-metal-associated domain-containing protein [Pararhodospirillum oryzae]|uniref:Heavy metal-binding protein n=1 Tax=Pararhodospirillum oryzae TaxID=478448 RepID=A0A512H964_9PROT|nr:heavy-metal-associated domain-containing protein [Pararhodospirillum oryzae]GEO81991.1 heavy metal-binding protein [Pararhodospirillum oryzae]